MVGEVLRVRSESPLDGGRLRQVREALGFTLAEVGQVAGVSEGMVCHVEHGRRHLERDGLWSVCKLFGDRGQVDAIAVAQFVRGYRSELCLTPIMDPLST